MKLAAAFTLALSAAPVAYSDPVSLFRCGTPQAVSMAAWDSVNAAYRQRSVAIIAASLAGESTTVRRYVSPDVRATYFPNDAGLTLTGPTAVVDLIRKTAPRDYEWVSGRGIPPPFRRPCEEITVSLTLVPAKRDMASLATFKFEGGLLVELQVNDADYAAGHFRPGRP